MIEELQQWLKDYGEVTEIAGKVDRKNGDIAVIKTSPVVFRYDLDAILEELKEKYEKRT